jgi:hypothetical protein
MKTSLLTQAVKVFMADFMYSAKKVKEARDKALDAKQKKETIALKKRTNPFTNIF